MNKLFLTFILTMLLGVNTVLAAKTPLVMVATSPDGTVKIILTDEPCAGKVAALIESAGPMAPEVKQATVIVKGKTMEACWMAMGGGVGILSEDGQEGMVGYEHFKPAEDV